MVAFIVENVGMDAMKVAREDEAPAEPKPVGKSRLGGSLALPF